MKKLEDLKIFFKNIEPEVFKYFLIGLFYCLIVKNIFSIYMMDADPVYIISNPSLQSELLFFIIPSFYFIIYLINNKWNKAFVNFVESIILLDRISLFLRGLRRTHKLWILGVFQFLLFIITGLFLIALYGCYNKYNEIIAERDFNIQQYGQLVGTRLYYTMAELELLKLRIVPSLIFCAITCLCCGFMVREKWKSILRRDK